MGARLVARGKGGLHAEFSLSRGRVAIGSAPDNGVVLTDKTISRRHAILEIDENSCVLTDAGSTNGTFVNGQRVSGPTPVRDGDELRLGSLSYVFRTATAPPVGAGPTFARRSWLNVVVPMALILFAGAVATSTFVINFSRLEITSLAGSSDATASASSRSAADAVPSPPPTEEAGLRPWLDALNRYRAMAGLAAVRDNPRLSPGAALHSRYIARNYSDEIRHSVNLGGAMHHEDPSKPGFTTAGMAAGLAGDVDEMWDPGGSAEVAWAIDDWMRGPFHRMSLLDPRLQSVGYGDYCAAGVCIATLNVHDGVDASSLRKPLTAPIEYPPNDASIRGADFTAEWPDPLTSCSGYTPPAGLPITFQSGPLVTPVISSYSLTLNGAPPASIEACAIDANRYTNPDAATQTMARELLREYGAVMIVPRKPLTAGRYTVALSASGRDYSWSFSVKP